MVRAIVLQALWEAARCGEYRASFRGFDIVARRQGLAAGADAPIAVRLLVRTRGRQWVRALVR